MEGKGKSDASADSNGSHSTGDFPSSDSVKSLAGVSREESKKSQITVSNANGYLCHISSTALLPCPPQAVFAVLTNPDNTKVFRDIKELGSRKILCDQPEGYKVVEVEQKGEVKILWHRHNFSTFLTVTEDGRDPNALRTSFELIKSDVLSKFQGSWTLYPGPVDEATGKLTTKACLEQDVLPAGVPEFMKRMPVVGSALRGICVRTVKRLLEDIEGVVQKTSEKGSLEAVLSSLSTNGNKAASQERLASHALSDITDTDESDDESAAFSRR